MITGLATDGTPSWCQRIACWIWVHLLELGPGTQKEKGKDFLGWGKYMNRGGEIKDVLGIE